MDEEPGAAVPEADIAGWNANATVLALLRDAAAGVVATRGNPVGMAADVLGLLHSCRAVAFSRDGCGSLNPRGSAVCLAIDSQYPQPSRDQISQMEGTSLQSWAVSKSTSIDAADTSSNGSVGFLNDSWTIGSYATNRYTGKPMILLTRKAEFSSAHYYWNDAWSKEQN